MAIALGAGTIVSSGATDTATIPLTVAAGDYVFLAINCGANTTTVATVNGPGAGQKAWTYLGQVTFGVFPQLFVLQNALAGSGSVTVQIVGRTYLFAAVQVYTGVAAMAEFFLPQGQVFAIPALGPGLVLFFDVTVPGSMGVSAFSWAAGSNVGLAVTGVRPGMVMYGSAQTLALKDQLFSALGPQQLSLDWSTTSTTPNQTRVSVLFTPQPAAVQVVISPIAASVTSGAVEQFIATVSGTPNTAVTWAASLGSIDATGLYTAPRVYTPTPGSVIATSVADPTATATAVLNILPAEPLILPPIFGGGFRRITRRKHRGVIWSDENLEEA